MAPSNRHAIPKWGANRSLSLLLLLRARAKLGRGREGRMCPEIGGEMSYLGAHSFHKLGLLSSFLLYLARAREESNRREELVGTGLRNRRKKTTSPVPMRREEQRRNRKVKGMFWASLHFSSKGHFFSHKLASFHHQLILCARETKKEKTPVAEERNGLMASSLGTFLAVLFSPRARVTGRRRPLAQLIFYLLRARARRRGGRRPLTQRR